MPATKALPKEVLPVVDKPAIQYVVEEAAASGLDDILMTVGRNKNALANHFVRQGDPLGLGHANMSATKLSPCCSATT